MSLRLVVASGFSLGLACVAMNGCGEAGLSASRGSSGATASNGVSSGATASGTTTGPTHASGAMSSGGTSSAGNDSGPALSGSGGPTAVTTCTTTVTAVDVSTPDTVIGTGTAASCTEAELSGAASKGGKITFNCGSAPAIISITQTITLRNDKDTTIDGSNLVTLDGGNKTRIFQFTGTNWQTTKTTVTLQHIAFSNARAAGTTTFVNTQPPCSTGYTDGQGGVILIQDGVLHVIDASFDTNHAAYPGPDTAGGAIYALGTLETTIVGSHFTNNDASNGGAIGALWGNLTVINSTFTGNKALGFGANSTNATCPLVGGSPGQRETGSGGNGAAISIDGGETFTVVMCGDVFSGNVGGTGALGGAIFRTPDGAMQEIDMDQCTFDGNQAVGAGAMYLHNSHIVVTNSTISNNVANGCGAIQADGSILDMTNVTIYSNKASTSPGGAVCLFGNSGAWTNVTFAKNQCDGAPGSGFAADYFGGTSLTIDNCVFDSASQQDPNAPMACQNTNGGGQDVQWPSTHSAGTNPDNPCVTGIDFADPQLGILSANGGPTQTALPAVGSPAIGIGKACPATDQRGMPRPAAGCTAGAVEAP